MLEQIPGVSTISAGSSISKPVIQGMHSSRIVLINNGVRLESQSWGTDHAPEIDHTGASIVEVIKGAESVRYGHGAIGGVALFNQAPLPFGHDRFYIKCKTNLGYATNGRAYDGAGSLEMGYKNWGLRLHGMYQKSGDYSTAEYLLNNTGFNNISFSGYAGYKEIASPPPSLPPSTLPEVVSTTSVPSPISSSCSIASRWGVPRRAPSSPSPIP